MSYCDLLEVSAGGTKRWRRLPIGCTGGRSEAWLRDTFQAHPDLLPVAEIDPAYAGLRPVCSELRTDAGPIDNVFINPLGRLTLVECKLWRNPESRRKVVAQILDYAKEVSRWSYSELQARVNARTGGTGNHLFEIARAGDSGLQEHLFVDATTRALQQGNFMLLIAGDGIREDVEALGELLGRNAAASFAFGMVEAALYESAEGAILLQPRLLSKVRVIERTVFRIADQFSAFDDDGTADERPAGREASPGGGGTASANASRIHVEARAWWEPVIAAPLQDPDQLPLKYHWPHHVRAPLPWPGTWVTAYRSASEQTLGVFLSGRKEPRAELMRALAAETDDFLNGLPDDTVYVPGRELGVSATLAQFANEDEQREWLLATLNSFIIELRPRAARLMPK